MSNSAILTVMLVALCVARLATVPFGSGADHTEMAKLCELLAGTELG